MQLTRILHGIIYRLSLYSFFFFLNDPPPPEFSPLPLPTPLPFFLRHAAARAHRAPVHAAARLRADDARTLAAPAATTLGVRPVGSADLCAGARRSAPALPARSEEHTSELQSLAYLVCRLLLEKKN